MQTTIHANTDKTIISVSELTFHLKNIIEDTYPRLSIQGEISNLTRHRSGHNYFTLKDDKSQLRCVMWRDKFFPANIEEGAEVICTGRLTVYPQGGSYQLDCNNIKEVGLGNLYEKFIQMKARLELKGYFAPEQKRSLPRFPTSVGIITSATGAALQDILSTLQRRAPFLKVYIRPTQVQGEYASNDLIQALHQLATAKPDIILLARGGGSIEDLWCFNSEALAEAIYESEIPIISGVGHETDFTITDFVADVRAATPTAAAEIISNITKGDILDNLDYYEEIMQNGIGQTLHSISQRLALFSPDILAMGLVSDLRNTEQSIDHTLSYISKSIQSYLNRCFDRIDYVESDIGMANPESILKKGFALLYSEGRQIQAEQQLVSDDKIEIRRFNQKDNAVII